MTAFDPHNPHGTLGAHETKGGVVVRVFRPEATKVRVLPFEVELEAADGSGFFEGVVKGADLPLDYELEIAYPDGGVYTMRDPYSFLPTLGELDLHLAAEGRHEELASRLGAHARELDGVRGVAFSVWAPNARAVSVVGDFNGWDGRLHPLRTLGSSGVWELFVPGADVGTKYKFEVHGADGKLRLKADPLEAYAEVPPANASIVFESKHEWADEAWLERRRDSTPHAEPMSVYEVHLGSWRPGLSYLELADQLTQYVLDLGFTHVELLPVMEHPFAGSWGYQVTGYFAPTSRFGNPDEFRVLVDRLHEAGIGVILDWVPAHFPKDDWALARFDGTALYEHADPRRGEHPDWGTYVFNYSRTEVRNFLLASALHWLREYHGDGIRVDAVASMLYLDYSRKAGEWVPNEYGGNEDLDAISFLRDLNEVAYGREPGIAMTAEESTAWPGVSKPTWVGGLGFGFKWNMGWMHDTLDYFQREPIHRRFHHHQLTFGLLYAFSENFVLPLSHDEVVHGKGSLLTKMPGDDWQQFANLRSLYGLQWAHPGKQLLFMGCEFAQRSEWNGEYLDWHLLEHAPHAGMQQLIRDLNGAYKAEPALWEVDHDSSGFRWIEANDADANTLCFLRCSRDGERVLACLCNLSPVPRHDYRVGLPRGGRWVELMNTDSSFYGGSGIGNMGSVEAAERPWHELPFSAEVSLPPLGVVWLVPEEQAP
jgi:1,4-alpha-glucan branching enzyme